MLNVLASPEDIMFAMKRKPLGGEGIHPDLQTTPRLQTSLNGIEEKIKSLTRKRLTIPQMKKESKQLTLLAYKVASLAQLTEEWTSNIRPAGGQKTPRNWQRWSKDVRDQAVKLAVAANQANPNAASNAASNLLKSCTRCHVVFKP
jgi:hypothetical protein